MTYEYPPPPRRPGGPPSPYDEGTEWSPPAGRAPSAYDQVNWGRLIGAGFATSVVAALVPVVGLLIARGVFNVQVLVHNGSGSLVTVTSGAYAAAGFAAGLLATVLLLLLVSLHVPSPGVFFSVIVLLVTGIAVATPFTTGVGTNSAVATAAINGAIGLVILLLLGTVAPRSP